MSRRRTTSSRPVPLLLAAGLVLGACGGGSSDGAEPTDSEATETTPTITEAVERLDEDRSEDPPDGDGDVAATDVEGRPLVPGGTDDVARTRDRLAAALGTRPAFDAVVLAAALGYDYEQLRTAAEQGGLALDGSIVDEDGPVTPSGPPARGPQGLRAVPAAPVGAATLIELWTEVGMWEVPPEGAFEATIENKELFVLEAIIGLVAAGLRYDEVVGYVLLGIEPSCESVRYQKYLQVKADEFCQGVTIGPTTTVSESATTSSTTTTTPDDGEDATTVDGSGGAGDAGPGAGAGVDQTYVGTVQFDLGIGAGTPAVNELFLIATTGGLVGTYEYQAAGDGFCVAATANLDDDAVVEVAPGQYSGPVEIIATVWDGACGSADGEVIPFVAQLEGRLEGQQIVGTLDESGQILPFTATLSDVS